MNLPEEAGQLIRHLAHLSLSAEAGPEIQRLLHSLKSLAALDGRSGLAELCHDWEARFAEAGAADGDMLAALHEATADMELLLREAPDSRSAPEPESWNCLTAPLPALDERELRLVASARADGAEIRWCRAWISPEEPWPLMRVMLLVTRLEALGIIRAEAWLADGLGARGPFDPRAWIDGRERPQDWNGRGAWLRCLYLCRRVRAPEVLQVDQVEDVLDTPCPPQDWVLPGPPSIGLALVNLAREDIAFQSLLLESMELTPPRPAILRALGGRAAGGHLPRFLQGMAAHGASSLPEDSAIRWQFYDEGVQFSRQTLATVAELVGQLGRNSLAHGIQPAAARLAALKNAATRISLSLWEEDGSVCLDFGDDGPGIDAAAVEKRLGLVAGSLADQADLLAAIEGAGVSTREQADGLGGRGYGLNLVAQLARGVLGGSLQLVNRPGRGVRFRLRFDAGLADLAVLLVRQGERNLAVPQVWIGACLDLGDSPRISHDRQGCEFLMVGADRLELDRGDCRDAKWGLLVRPDGGGMVLCADSLGIAETVLVRPRSRRVFSRQAGGLVDLWLPAVAARRGL